LNSPASPATGNTYPTFAGGTLKSAGHVYSDQAGNTYNIPDAEFVVELSENVVGGVVSSMALGDGFDNPTSFVVGNLLLIMNPDPRFDNIVLGALDTTVPISVFETQGLGQVISAVGHMVGPHVFFVQELGTNLLDTTLGPFILTERFQFDDADDEIRFRGQVSEKGTEGEEDELYMKVLISDGIGTTRDFQVDILPPDVIGAPGGIFGFRSRGDFDVASVTQITVALYYKRGTGGLPADPGFHTQDEEVFSEIILRSDVTGQ